MPFRDPFPIILSDDLTRLTEFYRLRLGFSESFRFPGPDEDGEAEFVVLGLGSAQFGFGRAATPALHGQPRAAGTGNRVEICLYADDVDEAVEALRSAGTPVLYEPADQPFGERAAYVADPDGNPILIVAPLAQPSGNPSPETP